MFITIRPLHSRVIFLVPVCGYSIRKRPGIFLNVSGVKAISKATCLCNETRLIVEGSPCCTRVIWCYQRALFSPTERVLWLQGKDQLSGVNPRRTKHILNNMVAAHLLYRQWASKSAVYVIGTDKW